MTPHLSPFGLPLTSAKLDPARRLFLTLTLVAASSLAPLTFADNTARLLGPAGKCLGVQGAALAGAAVALETCSDAADQLWQLPTQGFGGPIVGEGGYCLDVTGASTADNAALQLFACHGGENQVWRYDGSGLVGGSGKCLAIKNGGTLDGTPAVLFTCHGGDNQRFLAETQDAWSRITGDVGRRALSDATTWVTSDPAIFYNTSARDAGRSVIERSEDAGQTWSVLSALPVGSRFLLDDVRDPDVFFFTDAYSEFLLRSDDGGRSYQAVLETGNRPLALAQDPTRHSRFFAIVGFEIWRSDDDGKHFTYVGASPAGVSKDRLVFGADGTLYFESKTICFIHVCQPGSGIFRSRDGGVTWQALSYPFAPEFATLYPHPTQGQVLYLHNQVLSGSGQLLRSEDAGATWVELRLSASRFFYTTPVAGDSLWSIEGGLLWRSEDRGTTWTTSSLPLPAPFEPNALKISYGPGIRIRAYASEGLDSYRIESLDGGATWDGGLEPPQTPPKFSSLIPAARAGRFFSLNGAELWRSDDGARTWQKTYTFAEDGRYDQVVTDPLRADSIYLRIAANLLMCSQDAGQTFTALPGPGATVAGNFTAVVHAGQTVLLDLTPNTNELRRSTDAGSTWSPIYLPTPVAYLEVDGTVLYAHGESDQLLRSLDGGATWGSFEIGASPTMVAAGGGRIGFLRTEPTELRISQDFGATWASRILPPGTGTEFLSIDHQGRIYVQDSTYQLFRSRDNGQTWESFGRDLPRISREVFADPYDADRLFAVGRRIGPYFAGTDDLGIWSGRFTGENLLLGQGRFAVRLTWKDPQGATGVGRAVAGTSDTGFFWLFSPNRSEVAVKILDGRPLNGRFWVFVASLSNVEFDVEIEDLVEGTRHTYHNPQGVMASFADTQTFPLDGPEEAGAAYQPTAPVLLPPFPNVLLLDRFEITVTWQDFGGQTGTGLGGPLNDESAGFYFFDTENLELIVNVIDGRPINGHYWVFFAGLSNVEYVVTVRDRQTGATQIYHNPLGIFASSADTTAF